MTLTAAYHSGVIKIYVPRFWEALKSSIFDTVNAGILLCTDNKGQFNNNGFYIINSTFCCPSLNTGQYGPLG